MTIPPGVTLPEIPIGPLRMDGRLPVFILGPCVMESEDFLWKIGRAIKEVAVAEGVPFVFKASYDKANRTSISSYRGMSCRDGCKLLAEIGQDLGVPVTTDVHSVEEARTAAEFVDILQIPAFLCRQTDLITAAAETMRVVNVKKGQFLAPWDVKHIAAKLVAAGNDRFFFTERGASFGYNTLVADMRSLYWMREQGYRVCFDATHSVQRPGGLGGTSGGDGILAPVLARAAVAAGCDAVFMETHFDPAQSLSDGPNMIHFDDLAAVVRKLKTLHLVANQD